MPEYRQLQHNQNEGRLRLVFCELSSLETGDDSSSSRVKDWVLLERN